LRHLHQIGASQVIETGENRGLPKEGTSQVHGICDLVADTFHDVA
jgi:hypothetical protein